MRRPAQMSMAVPPIGVSSEGDRCHVAENRLVALVNGIGLDLTTTLKEASSEFPFPVFEPTDSDKRVGTQLGVLRHRAGLTADAVAAVLKEDRDGEPKQLG